MTETTRRRKPSEIADEAASFAGTAAFIRDALVDEFSNQEGTPISEALRDAAKALSNRAAVALFLRQGERELAEKLAVAILSAECVGELTENIELTKDARGNDSEDEIVDIAGTILSAFLGELRNGGVAEASIFQLLAMAKYEAPEGKRDFSGTIAAFARLRPRKRSDDEIVAALLDRVAESAHERMALEAAVRWETN
jgi:hypothetical protein